MLHTMLRPFIIDRDAQVLLEAATAPEQGLYGDGDSALRRRVRRLAAEGLLTWLDWRAGGWQRGM